MSPSPIAMKLGPGSRIPTAAVCLDDAMHAFTEARYALGESFAEDLWYRTKSDPPNEMNANFFGKFFADDMALRVYSAMEHFAEAIVFMLEIDEARLKPYEPGRVSRAAIIGNFLANEMPGHPLTEAAVSLMESASYRFTRDYRNEWVHSQPPAVKGLGISYRRVDRWRIAKQGEKEVRFMTFGGGDEPRHTLGELQQNFLEALWSVSGFATKVVEFYLELLRKRGVEVTSEGTTTFKLSA
jgi:hypothetical protein